MTSEDARAMTGQLRSSGIFHCDSRLGADVALGLPAMPDTAMLHLILDGTVRLETAAGSTDLGRGDLALLPHGLGHTLSTGGAEVTQLEDTNRPVLGGIVERLVLGGEPTVAHVVCAALTLAHPAAPPLPATLDDVVVVRADERADSLRTLALMIDDEVSSGRPGWVEVTSRLVDVVAMQSVRAALAASDLGPGIWTAVRDPALAPAMRAVTDQPHKDWSVERMASAAGLSRSAFAQRFGERVGEPPMTWVTRFRMGIAHGLLASGQPARTVARDVGYDSEVAFRRAFTRTTGTPPGAVRKRDTQ